MGNISITIGAETVTKEVDDARLQRLCNLFAAGLNYVDGATFADGGPPNTNKQKQRATLAGVFDHVLNWARERRRQELAAEAAITLENELK
jgi:hypothetical protein